MSRPLVGLVVGPREGAGLRPLARAVSATVDVRAVARCPRKPDGLIASGRAAVPRAWADVPLATVADGRVRVGSEVVALPAGALDVERVLPRGLLVRAQWRKRLGRPADWVAVAGDMTAAEWPDALAACSAAVVFAADVPYALALGTPVVTTGPAASAIEAVDGVHLLVAPVGADPITVAAALAADPTRAAAMSTAARRFAEDRLDLSWAAHHVLVALGLAPVTESRPRLEQRLAELHTPSVSRIRTRVAEATAALTGATA